LKIFEWYEVHKPVTKLILVMPLPSSTTDKVDFLHSTIYESAFSVLCCRQEEIQGTFVVVGGEKRQGFFDFTRGKANLRFELTPIGCGLAG
jgi:hypothetical protein